MEQLTASNMQNTVNDSAPTPNRAYALDALRGFAVLAMVLSGTIAYEILPAWMYHAQEPPPTHTYNPHLAGLTWVDVVFPLFLFSMGAAIPLALSRRLAKGLSINGVVLSIFKRGFLLGTFAIVLQHLRPQVINPEPDMQKWRIALTGFFLLFFMFVRWPDRWKPWQRTVVTLLSWSAAIVFLSQLRYPNGSGFSINRSDIILIILTNTAVFGSLIWLLTKSNLLARFGCLVVLFALRVSACTSVEPCAKSWIIWFWSASPATWIFKFEYLQYLFLVVPGTIAGEFILTWMQSAGDKTIEDNFHYSLMDQPHEEHHLSLCWSIRRFHSIIIFVFTLCLILLIGLQARWLWQTTLLSALICAASHLLFINPNTATERLLRNFYIWGLYLLGLGLLFEPFESGIKKDPPTMSYYFVTAGMAFLILIAFTVIIDVLNQQKWVQLLIDNGQNPMIAYVGFANLLWPILMLTGIDALVVENTKTPLLGFFKGLVYTLVIACIVSLFTRLKLFWRT